MYQWFKGRYPWSIEAALKKYGDVVRIAPNEIVFFTVQAQNGQSFLSLPSLGPPVLTSTYLSPRYPSKRHQGKARV
ncbi:uncharacterized protein PODANS_0_230 [Podospora anserina S mat+]|uniref:Podospora anserina S mat+ genomic DNA chromosome 6, supercontig 3 n=1 Tax=Podospora anserina (strain S / ATCC MYA-4624 / DSM 980 / FGSC 10383) TaxID=515849 RepID=B2AFV8_PODAN|nr:uncharacterized protein PODANS_0_230 [Podospora anserina S mat+]CAP62329.1 unnamed protein product [Podospora anserina S mat+]